MSKSKAKPTDSQGHDEIDLTADDEAALDKAWGGITDADIEASITWLNDIASDKPIAAKPKPAKRRHDPLDDL